MANHGTVDRPSGTNILVVEDHPLFVRAIQDLLREHYPHVRVDVASSCAAAASLLAQRPFATALCAILCDLDLPDANGIGAVQRLRSLSPCPLWVVSAASSQTIVDAVLGCGADGFISKRMDASGLLGSLRPLLGDPVMPNAPPAPGNPPVMDPSVLSASQQRVADQLVLGLSNKEIAVVLHLGLETVKSHVREIMARLQARNRTEAVLKLLRGRSH